MPNKRSKVGLEKQVARKQYGAVRNFLLATGFRDQNRAETVCTVTPDEAAVFLKENFPGQPIFSYVTQITRGEVLVDSRGCGSLQREGR